MALTLVHNLGIQLSNTIIFLVHYCWVLVKPVCVYTDFFQGRFFRQEWHWSSVKLFLQPSFSRKYDEYSLYGCPKTRSLLYSSNAFKVPDCMYDQTSANWKCGQSSNWCAMDSKSFVKMFWSQNSCSVRIPRPFLCVLE